MAGQALAPQPATTLVLLESTGQTAGQATVARQRRYPGDTDRGFAACGFARASCKERRVRVLSNHEAQGRGLVVVRAAVLTDSQSVLEIVDDLEVAEPRPGEVCVEVSHCGICHSDLTMINDGYVKPAVLGHEAAGVVAAVGAGVGHVSVGDKVMLTPVAPCGHCPGCALQQASRCAAAMSFVAGTRPDHTSPFSRAGRTVYRGLGVGAFAERTVVSASAVVRLDDDVPLEIACLIGCGVQTGVGAVLNTADVKRGSVVVVTGLGGVGMSVVQGARIAGAARIIASDPVASRREAASRLGATDLVAGSADDLREAVRDVTGGRGADYAFEAAGVASLIELGLEVTGRGGTTVIVGAAPVGDPVAVSSATLFMLQQKRLVGSLLGDCWPARDIPVLVGLWRCGQLDLESMITRRLPLSRVNEGFDGMRRAEGVRTVVEVAEAGRNTGR